MKFDQRPPPGTVVHLRPITRTASLACHRYLAVELVDAHTHWPMVVVRVGQMPDQQDIQVHADDVGLHPSKNKAKGDQASDVDRAEQQVRALRGKPQPLELPEGWEEQTLW